MLVYNTVTDNNQNPTPTTSCSSSEIEIVMINEHKPLSHPHSIPENPDPTLAACCGLPITPLPITIVRSVKSRPSGSH